MFTICQNLNIPVLNASAMMLRRPQKRAFYALQFLLEAFPDQNHPRHCRWGGGPPMDAGKCSGDDRGQIGRTVLKSVRRSWLIIFTI